MAKRAKQITYTNLSALINELARHGGTLPLRVDAVHATHLQRCYRAKLIERVGARLSLTETGKEACAAFNGGHAAFVAFLATGKGDIL